MSEWNVIQERERERERVLQAETIKPVERDDHNYTVQYPPLSWALRLVRAEQPASCVDDKATWPTVDTGPWLDLQEVWGQPNGRCGQEAALMTGAFLSQVHRLSLCAGQR